MILFHLKSPESRSQPNPTVWATSIYYPVFSQVWGETRVEAVTPSRLESSGAPLLVMVQPD